MALITSGNWSRLQQEGVKDLIGDAYNDYESFTEQMFGMETSDQSFEILVQDAGYGTGAFKDEGAGMQVDSKQEGYSPLVVMKTAAQSTAVTMEAMRDTKKGVFKNPSKSLGRSLAQLRQTDGANIFNRGYSSSYLQQGGDGVSLFNTGHIRGPDDSATYSNTLATPAALSETSVEELTIQIQNAKNGRGLNMKLAPLKLLVAPALGHDACRIMKSELQNDTANNAINSIRVNSTIRDGYLINPFLTSSTQWSILTDCPQGLLHFRRSSIEFDTDVDFATKNRLLSVIERYAHMWADPRGAYGSEGV